MHPLHKHLRKTAQRMRDVRFVQHVLQNLTLGLALLLTLVVVDKAGLIVRLLRTDWAGMSLWQNGRLAAPALGLPDPYGTLLLCVALLSILIAVLRTLAEGFTVERAALALDERAGLKERLTSATVLGGSELPMAHVLVEDATRTAARVTPAAAFPYHGGGGGRKLPVLAVGLLAALFFLPDLDLLGERERLRQKERARQEQKKEVKQIAHTLRHQARTLENEMKRRKIKNKKLEELTKKLKKLAADIEKQPAMDPEQAQKMVNKLKDKLKEEDKDSFAADRLQNLRVPRPRRSLMREAMEKMKQRDLSGASAAMRRLRRKLERNAFNPQELQRLSKEMKDLADQLERMDLQNLSKSFKDAAQELARLADIQKPNNEKMKELMDKALKGLKGEELDLSKLTEEEKQLLRKLQEALANMKTTEQMLQAMQQGRVRQLTMKEMKQLLQQMKQQQQQCEQCNGSGKCQQCKGTGKCQRCGGTGSITGPDGKKKPCPDCNGSGKCPKCSGSGKCSRCGGGGSGNVGLIPGSGMGNSGAGNSGAGGNGVGSAQGGQGRRPESKNPTKTYNTRIRARKLAKGQLDQMFIRGLPPGDREIKTQYVKTLEDVTSSTDSAREREQIPREDRDLVREYHNAIKSVE